jgi:hypothetical protein
MVVAELFDIARDLVSLFVRQGFDTQRFLCSVALEGNPVRAESFKTIVSTRSIRNWLVRSRRETQPKQRIDMPLPVVAVPFHVAIAHAFHSV